MLLAAVAALVVGAGCAAEKEAVRTETVMNEADGVREGRVVAVDERRLVLLDPGGASAGLVFDVTEETAWMQEGESVRHRTVDEGDEVRVFFENSGERPDALRVEILQGDEEDAVEEELDEAMPED
jgi:hypothetical protein